MNLPLFRSAVARRLLLPAVFMCCTAGVYRHDVPTETFHAYAQLPQFAPVGFIATADGANMSGSCVLIDPTHVLSAAHCAVDRKGNYLNRHWETGKEGVMLGGKWYCVEDVRIHPSYKDANGKEGIDLMVLRLNEAVAGISPARLSTGSEKINDTASLIGFGAFGAGFPTKTLELGKGKSGGQNVIDSFGGPLVKGVPSYLYMDMDDPRGKAPNRMGGKQSLPLEFMCAGGDSGGGSFVQQAGIWYLLGITTGVQYKIAENSADIYYGCVGEWTRVSIYADWIRSQLQK